MFKKILIKLKPILIKWLDKIDHIEQSIQVTSKVKSINAKYGLPVWFLILGFFVVIVISFFVKILKEEPLIEKNLFFSIGLRITIFLVLFFFVFKIYRFFRDKLKIYFGFQLEQYEKDILLFWTLVLIALVFILIFKLYEINFFIFPVCGFTLLAGLTLGVIWSLIFSVLVPSLGCYIYFGSSEEIFIGIVFYVISSLYVLTKTERIFTRKDFIPIIIKSTLINVVISVSLYVLIKSDLTNFFIFDIKKIFIGQQVNILNLFFNNILGGFFSWLIISVFLSPIELIYKRTTNIKLLELANFNNPLLKKLMAEAPGTYHHSLIVSSLAENVASNLGLNSLLCKVAGYYHDIGKIVSPDYFIENQIAIKNPHSEINPSLSALVIVNHVKEGVKLAKEYNLDQCIIDIIQQHHGNSLIYGLYDKNLELGLLDKEVLRYPGPKPQTKEAAIVMICDSCEAACRSIAEPDAQKIKQTVERVINNKFIEGQFDEVPLTLRDLYKISNIVTQMLISFYHLRTSRI